MPQREYATEPTSLGADGKPRGKGYRIVTSLNPNVSAVERSLDDARIVHYMPCETRVIRNRDKTRTFTTRRFALLPGYIFVANIQDWLALDGVPGVTGYLRNSDGSPLGMSVLDILTLRTIEAKSEADAQAELHKLNMGAIAAARKTAQKALTAAKRQFYAGVRVKALWGAHAGREAVIQGWTDDQKLKAIIEGLESHEVLPFDAVRKVA